MEKNIKECLKRDNWVVLSKFISVVANPDADEKAKEIAKDEVIAFVVGSNSLTDFSNISILTELLSYDIKLYSNEHIAKVSDICLAQEANEGTPEFYHLSGLVSFAKNKKELKGFGSNLRAFRMARGSKNPIVVEIVDNFSNAMEGYNQRAAKNYGIDWLKFFCDREKAFEINSIMWLEKTVSLGTRDYNIENNPEPFKDLIRELRSANKDKSAEKGYSIAKATRTMNDLKFIQDRKYDTAALLKAYGFGSKFDEFDRILSDQMEENYKDHIEESSRDGYMSEAIRLGMDMIQEASSSPCN